MKIDTLKTSNVIMKDRCDGYNEAAKIDETINELCKTKKIEDYPFFWLAFCRTVKTGLDIIETLAMEELKKP